MRLIAHRGFADAYPENTLAGVRLAAQRANAVEIDVRRCATGELVVIHDETLDRVTDLTGRVADCPLQELRDCSVLGSGEGVPTFGDVLDAVPESATVHAELKDGEAAADLAAILRETDRSVVVSSFDPDALETVSNRWGGPVAFLFDRNPKRNLSVAESIGCDYVHPHKRLCFTSNVVDRAHEAGMVVNAWTVRTRTAGRLLEFRNVDGLIADHWSVTG